MQCKRSDCFVCPHPDCINDYVAPAYRPTAEKLEKQRKRRRERYEKARASDLCGWCMKRPATQGRTSCTECRNKYNRNRAEAYHRKGKLSRDEMDGVTICMKCGNAEPKERFKLCEKCYTNAVKALKKTPTHNGKKPNNYFTVFNEVFYARKADKE